MRDYGKMFLGLILAGILLIVIGLWLVSHRNTDGGQVRPAFSESSAKVGPELFWPQRFARIEGTEIHRASY